MLADEERMEPQESITARAGDGQGGRRRKCFLWLLLAAGLAVAFYQNVAHMWVRWFPNWTNTKAGLYDRIVEGESYYTHGPLVPLISLFIVLLLVRYTRVPVRPRPGLGFTLLTLSLLGHLLACRARVNFVSGYAMVGVLGGLVLALWGGKALRRFWFPIVLLAFMVPAPEVAIHEISYWLKDKATLVGVASANGLGIVAERVGNRVLMTGDKELIVGNVCNGLRTLISVIGFGAMYAYVCRLRGIWRPVLFAASVPVALVANSLRVVALIVVADIWTVNAATGWFHDLSGLLIFVLAFMMMFGIEKLILWSAEKVGRPFEVVPLQHNVRRDAEDEGQFGRLIASVVSRRGWVAVSLVVLVAAGAVWINKDVNPYWAGTVAREALPERLDVPAANAEPGAEPVFWRGRDMTLPERDLRVLGTGDYAYRRYIAAREPSVDFLVIFSADNRKGIHPPELCIDGSGDSITERRDLDVVVDVDVGVLPCRELRVQKGDTDEYVLYTYKCADTYTSNFWKQQWLIFWNGLWRRDSSGALIRVSTAVSGNMASARARAVGLLREGARQIDDKLSQRD
jgi:EpsI family protein